MASERVKRIYRKASAAERQRHAKAREQIASELPKLRQRAAARLNEVIRESPPLRHVLVVLRAERERMGLSLNDIFQRTGIDRAALSRLENSENANPTLTTLERYAEALGKHMVVVLTDARPPSK